MIEAYAEWLVKKKTPAYYMILKPVMVIVCVIALLLAVMTPLVGMLALLAAAAATYFVFRNSNLEYEYIYVTGQLTFDKIMGQAKRKTVKSVDMEEVQVIAPLNAYQLKDLERSGMKTLDFSSGTPGAKCYGLIMQKGSETTKIIFEPNDKMLQCLRQAAPRKVVLQ